ncbi:hypothetical protein [Erythrobacter sp.]|uniref:hypothetical protein n=1 Tax=Erythrobacter sp. TaxID=1042 RepID=UPI001425F71D|nr:hypothetical protein [Erythrobacter sp.]QIQ86179.1 MAG: hypothetical protein G9473_05365 [Erythrobacter sp.]
MNLAPARFAAFAACALIAAPAVSAADPQEEKVEAETAGEQDEAASDAKTEAKEDKRICRRIRTDMSSRRKTRVCLTAEEWRELNQRR